VLGNGATQDAVKALPSQILAISSLVALSKSLTYLEAECLYHAAGGEGEAKTPYVNKLLPPSQHLVYRVGLPICLKIPF
jgi:hypothetical protein